MSELDIDRNFPMRDEASARLMIVKAECLLGARAISESQRLTVLGRALGILDQHRRRDAA
jgi:hypothetical protein